MSHSEPSTPHQAHVFYPIQGPSHTPPPQHGSASPNLTLPIQQPQHVDEYIPPSLAGALTTMHTNALDTSSAATELAHQVFQQQQVVTHLQNTTEQRKVVDVQFRETAEKERAELRRLLMSSLEQQGKWTEFILREQLLRRKTRQRCNTR